MTAARLRFVLAAALAAATLVAYSPVFQNGFVNFDDDHYILLNPALREGLTAANVRWAFTTGYGANWFPLTWLSWMADRQLFGLDPRAFHATSLLLHVAAVELLFLLLARATGDAWRSAFVAGVLALHPLHVESVAWASTRKDVLSGLLWMLATLAYLRYVERPGLARHALVTLALVLGLMAKPMLVTLPLTLLLLDFWPLRRWRPGAAIPLVREKLPWLFVALASAVVTFLVQRASGAVASMQAFALGERVRNALVSYVAYLRDALWPSALAPYYPHAPVGVGAAALCGLALLAASVGAFWLRRSRPAVLVGWLFYLVTLVPVIGLVQVGEQARADRYTYIPLAGIAIALAWGVTTAAAPRLAVAAGSLALLACIPLTMRQAAYWRDSGTLFEHTLSVTGPNAFAHTNLGIAHLEGGRFEPAARELEAAIRLDPGSAEAQGALGEALARGGRHADARTHFEAALRLDPSLARVHNAYGRSLAEAGEAGLAQTHFREAIALAPLLAEPYNNLGAILLEQGSPEAVDYIRRAAALDPSLAAAQANWGRALLRQGRPQEALEHFRAASGMPGGAGARREWGQALLAAREFDAAALRFQEALERDPEDAVSLSGLGLALAHLGRFQEAARAFERAAASQPNDAEILTNWGKALANQGQTTAAIDRFQAALARDPGSSEAHNALGMALGNLGRMPEALAEFRRAVELQPDSVQALSNWALALADQGRVAEAVERLREAVRLDPDYADARINLGVFLARLGRLEEARNEFRETLRIDPSRADARGNLRKIEEALAPRSRSR